MQWPAPSDKLATDANAFFGAIDNSFRIRSIPFRGGHGYNEVSNIPPALNRTARRVAVVSLLAVTVWWPARASAALALNADQVAQRLRDITPKFPAPPIAVVVAPGETPPPLGLVGVDLSQNKKPIVGAPAVLDPAYPLEIVAYWTPRANLRTVVDVELRFASANPLIYRTERLTAGPEDGTTYWNADTVYRKTYTLDLRPIAQLITGKCSLILGLSLRTRSGTRYYPLQRVAASLISHTRKAAVSRSAEKAAFGDSARSLDTDFVFGLDAHQALPIPAQDRNGVTAIGVVSAFGYGPLSQGAPVCEIIFHGENGRTAKATMECGVDTARADYDFLPPGQTNHKKVQIVESSDWDYSSEGRPFRRHKYAGRIPVPAGIGRVASLEFHALTNRFFEVYDVLLLYGKTPQ